MQDMRENFFPKFIEICMETPFWSPKGNMAVKNNPKHLSLSFAKPKGVNLSLEELKNVLKNTFSSTRTVQIAKFPIISHFFFSAVMLMPRHAKA